MAIRAFAWAGSVAFAALQSQIAGARTHHAQRLHSNYFTALIC